jgi:multiple sugar transport system substrate-binding protein
MTTAAAGAGGLMAASAFSTRAFAQESRIRLYWWGNPERDRRTFEVIDTFMGHHDGVEVAGETVSWSDYWTKLATQTAGGNMADLVQMDYRYLFEYVRRGAILPLDDYSGSTLDVSNFDQSALDGGKVDGKLYALNIGSNSQVSIFNTRLIEEAGEEFDPIEWTYDDLMRVAKAVSENTAADWGTDDLSLGYVFWEDWAQQAGHPFFADDGSIGGRVGDLADYWRMWTELRDAGAAQPGDVAVSLIGTGMNETGLVTGTTAFSYMWSNQIVGMQSLMQDTVGAAKLPGIPDSAALGQFIKPSMFLSLTRDTGNPELATTFMSEWVNDPGITGILSLERGIPASSVVRDALAPSFTPAEQISVDYFSAIQGKIGTLPPPDPAGAGEVSDAFVRWGTEVLLGNMSPDDAASAHFDEAAGILARAA